MTNKKLTAEQQARVDRARAAAEGPDKADLIRQAKAAQKLTESDALIITQLRVARESAGISLREVEERTGISRGNLSRLETGDGRTIGQVGSTGNVYLFAGEQWDAATGLDYVRARNMDTASGRFFGIDPFEGLLQSSVTLRRFLFAGNNGSTACSTAAETTTDDQ
jgi:RHS repeat-associated protein